MSLHFYSYNEDIPKKESLIDFENIFKKFINNVPSLKEALYQMFKLAGIPDQEIYDLTNEILLKSEKIIKFNFDIIKEKYPFITIEEAKLFLLIHVRHLNQIIVHIKYLIEIYVKKIEQ